MTADGALEIVPAVMIGDLLMNWFGLCEAIFISGGWVWIVKDQFISKALPALSTTFSLILRPPSAAGPTACR